MPTLRILLFLIAAVVASGSAMAAEKIRIALPTSLSLNDAKFGFGEELGFFAEEGLSLEYVALHGSGLVWPQVAAKSVTVGAANPDLGIVAMAKGEPYPVTYVYNYMRKSVYELAVKEASPIKTVADLKGKKLGIGALAWGNIPMVRAILRDDGIEWGKDIQIRPIGSGPAAWKQFADGNVDVMAYFAQEHARIIASGIPIRLLPIPQKYELMFSAGLIFHNDTIANNPKLVEGFGRAMAKSTVACLAAPRACMRAYWRMDPSAKPRPEQEEAWLDTHLPILRATDPSLEFFTPGEPREWGRFLPSSWKQHIAVMHAGGQIPVDNVPIERMYTNKFIPAMNKFDADAVIRLARSKEAARQ